MAENANPTGYGRRPEDGTEVSRAELNRRQAVRLNQTDNGELVDGQKKPFVTPEGSKK
jgi:hypothetical protein